MVNFPSILLPVEDMKHRLFGCFQNILLHFSKPASTDTEYGSQIKTEGRNWDQCVKGGRADQIWNKIQLQRCQFLDNRCLKLDETKTSWTNSQYVTHQWKTVVLCSSVHLRFCRFICLLRKQEIPQPVVSVLSDSISICIFLHCTDSPVL